MPRPQQRLLNEGFFEFKSKAGPGLCWVKHCRNSRKHDRCLCNKHNMQRWRAKRECPAAYHTLKHHAKARRIKFTITVDYFRGLTDAYCFFKQDDPDEILTIDRVEAHKGYEPGNLRVVSISINIAKGNRERYLPEHIRDMMRREREAARAKLNGHLKDEENENCPF